MLARYPDFIPGFYPTIIPNAKKPPAAPLDALSAHRRRGRGLVDTGVLYTVERARGGVRNTSGITQTRQARGGAHLGLHHNRHVPQVGTSQPEVWV